VIDAGVPAEAVVAMPARPAEQLPQPRKRPKAPAPPRTPGTWAWTALFGLLVALAGAWPALGVYLVTDRIREGRIPPLPGQIGLVVSEYTLIRWAGRPGTAGTDTADRRGRPAAGTAPPHSTVTDFARFRG
jgi:hypothetical protein